MSFFFAVDESVIPAFNQNMDYDNTDGVRPGRIRTSYNSDGTPRVDVWAKNDTGGAFTAGRPYRISFAGSLTEPVKAVVPATHAGTHNIIGIAHEAVADQAYGWFAIAGYVYDLALVDGDTVDVAEGDALEVINAGTGLIKDATGTVNVVAYALEANASTAAAKNIFMPGQGAVIAAAA